MKKKNLIIVLVILLCMISFLIPIRKENDDPVLEVGHYETHYTYEEYLMALSNGGLREEPFIERQKEPLKSDIIFDSNGEIKKLNNKFIKRIDKKSILLCYNKAQCKKKGDFYAINNN